MVDHQGLEVIISLAQESDYQKLAQFFEDNSMPEVTRYFHPFSLTLQTATYIALTNHTDRYYIAVRDELIVGLCMLRGWDEGFDIPSFGILVDYRYRRLGLGRQMTEYAVDAAISLKCTAIRLSVYASNSAAISLYESLGFREIHRDTVIVAGQQDQKIVMTKELE